MSNLLFLLLLLFIIQIWISIFLLVLLFFYHSHHIKVIVSFPHLLCPPLSLPLSCSHVMLDCVLWKIHWNVARRRENPKTEEKKQENETKKKSKNFCPRSSSPLAPLSPVYACLEWNVSLDNMLCRMRSNMRVEFFIIIRQPTNDVHGGGWARNEERNEWEWRRRRCWEFFIFFSWYLLYIFMLYIQETLLRHDSLLSLPSIDFFPPNCCKLITGNFRENAAN